MKNNMPVVSCLQPCRAPRLFKMCALFLALLSLTACSSVYFNAMEKVGVYKREILVDRINDTSKAQSKGKEELVSAMDRFKQVVTVEPSKLEKTYEHLNSAYDDAKSAAKDIREKIEAVETVANALFDEWEEELQSYSDPSLRDKSKANLTKTKRRYADYLASAKASEKKLHPALSAMQDQVLFLKHNLNMTAISSIKTEVTNIDKDVTAILQSIDASMKEAENFIKELS